MKRLLLLVLLSIALCSGALASDGALPKHKSANKSCTWALNLEEFISTGEPNQRFPLSTMGIVQCSVQITIAQIPWIQITSFADSLPDSLHFLVTTDEAGISWINFGDGVHGAIPPAGESIHAQYDHPTPEPSGVLALSIGLFGIMGVMRRKRQ